MRRATRILLAILAVYGLLGVSPASAEWYIMGYAGLALPNNEDIDVNSTVNGASVVGTLQNVNFTDYHGTSVVFGGKVGYFFGPAPPSFGVEVEGYHFTPDAGAQRVNFSGSGSGTVLGVPVTGSGPFDLVAKIDMVVTGIALNVIWRPIPGAFQPYVGVGGVAAIGELAVAAEGISDTDVAAGFQALVGLEWLPTPNLGIFIEYKFLQTTNFEFNSTVGGASTSLKFDMTANMFYGGIAWHFR